MDAPTDPDEARLRDYALSFPEAHEDFPWGERAIKVRGKVFVFLHQSAERGLAISTKLPDSVDLALTLPFAQPTGYGLGKSGWVSAAFEPGEEVPVSTLCAWIAESYRAIAPKTLVKQLAAAPAVDRSSTNKAPAAATKKPAAKKPAAKKPAAKQRAR